MFREWFHGIPELQDDGNAKLLVNNGEYINALVRWGPEVDQLYGVFAHTLKPAYSTQRMQSRTMGRGWAAAHAPKLDVSDHSVEQPNSSTPIVVVEMTPSTLVIIMCVLMA